MSRTVAIVQARVASERLPGKVLYELAGRPLIGLMIARLARARALDGIAVASGDRPVNAALAPVVEEAGARFVRGPEEDVLARYAAAAQALRADVIVRLTGDCPLIDPGLVDRVVAARAEAGADFATNVRPPTWPDGMDVAVFSRALLEAAAAEATRASDREHVVPWMWRHVSLGEPGRFRGVNLASDRPLAHFRLTVDEPQDYALLRALARALGPVRLVGASLDEIVALLEARPELAAINRDLMRDSGLARSVAAETGHGEGP